MILQNFEKKIQNYEFRIKQLARQKDFIPDKGIRREIERFIVQLEEETHEMKKRLILYNIGQAAEDKKFGRTCFGSNLDFWLRQYKDLEACENAK